MLKKSQNNKTAKISLKKRISLLYDDAFTTVKEFKETYDYSYSGMLKTLIWFYEIKGNSIEKANGGIGIIPFVYKDALNYYYNVYMAQMANKEVKYKPAIKEITIESPEVYIKPPKMFNVGEDE